MSSIHHLCRCRDTLKTDGLKIDGSNVECQFCLCSPHPAIQMVVLSNHNLVTDRAVPHTTVPHITVPHTIVPHTTVPHTIVPHTIVPHTMVCLANQAVNKFNLNPTEVVWVEHIPAKGSNSSCAGFNLIQFDWFDGQATSSCRSPIYEDWYLSWLETEIYG